MSLSISAEVGDLKLVENFRVLSGPGGNVNLTPRAYALAKMFMLKPGTLFSRQEVATNAWDNFGDRCGRNVDVAIVQFRKALKAVRSVVQLSTVYGAGYRLDKSPEDALASKMGVTMTGELQPPPFFSGPFIAGAIAERDESTGRPTS